MIQNSLPRPSDLLEELANKVIDAIDKLAVGNFKSALTEMVDYHGFLLDAYATKTNKGLAFSYAEVEGNWFGGPHHNWIRQYARVFERAATYIGQETEFIETLAGVPLRLLSGRITRLSPAVIEGILDLGSILVSRLEDWVTRRVSVENAPGKSATPRLVLAGSDKTAFSTVLLQFVGAWETPLRFVGSLFNWKDIKTASKEQQWTRLAATWPFLEYHLRNSAYFIALAVWNEDDIAAEQFRDNLVRWLDIFSFEFDEQHYSPYSSLLFPDLFYLKWNDAEQKLDDIEGENRVRDTNPFSLATTLIHRAHDDAILLTSGVLLRWLIDQKQSTDIAARTVASLLVRESVDSDDLPRRINVGFRQRFFEIMRLDFAGNNKDDDYGRVLDRFAAHLDGMSERRVVPGRIYTPSTISGRRDLPLSFVMILLQRVPMEGDDNTIVRLTEMISNETRLPNGDRSLIDSIHFLEMLSNALKANSDRLKPLIAQFRTEIESDKVAGNLLRILDTAGAAIKDHRTAKVKKLPIDLEKLECLVREAQNAILTPPAHIPIFRNFVIQKLAPRDNIPVVERALVNGIPKGSFTKPQLDTSSVDIDKMIVQCVTDLLARFVWQSFWHRSRQVVTIEANPTEPEFWKRLQPYVLKVANSPALMLPDSAERLTLMSWLHYPEKRTHGISVERKPRTATGDHYLVSIGGIDVYSGDIKGKAVLLSSQALKRIEYAPTKNGDLIELIPVNEDDPWKMKLRVKFAQAIEWDESPVFELHFPDKNRSAQQ